MTDHPTPRRPGRRRLHATAAVVGTVVALLLTGCGQDDDPTGTDDGATEAVPEEASPNGSEGEASPTDEMTAETPDEEPMMPPEGATELTIAEGTVDTYDGLSVGVTTVTDGVATLDVSSETDSLVGRFAAGDTFQVGAVLVGVASVDGDVVRIWTAPGQHLPEDGVTLPVPGQRAFGEEAGLSTRVSDPSLAEFGVRTDPEAGLGRGWEYVDLDLEDGATAELAGYSVEVVEVGDGAVTVSVTAPDGERLPRSE